MSTPMSMMEERIEAAARAGYAVTMQRHNATMGDERFKLLPFDEEPEGLRDDWRAFMRAALPAAFPELLDGTAVLMPTRPTTVPVSGGHFTTPLLAPGSPLQGG